MPTDRNSTCAERIAGHRDSRLSYIGSLNDLASVYDTARLEEVTEDSTTSATLDELANGEEMTCDEIAEAAQTALWEMPLAITTQTVHRIDLSTGGPADWLEVFTEPAPHGCEDVARIVYHFADWFDHASVELTGHDFDTAEQFARTVIGLD